MGRIIKFSQLEPTLQRAFFMTEIELEALGFKYVPDPMDKRGTLFMMVFIPLASTLMLFLGGVLGAKIPFMEIIKWGLIWFGIISCISFISFYPKYKKTSHGAGYLLTNKELLWFRGKDEVHILPLDNINVNWANEEIVFKSGEVSFGMRYEYISQKQFGDFIAELIVKLPRIKEDFEKILRNQKKSE